MNEEIRKYYEVLGIDAVVGENNIG